MSWRWASFVLIAAAVNGVQSPDSFSEERGARPGRCYAMRVGAVDSLENHDQGNRASVFSVRNVKDLQIEVSLSAEAASWPVRVRLFTPRGKLYQVLHAVAEPQPASEAGRNRRRSRRHMRSLVARFPVAGTQITSYALFGEWRAEAYLNDAESPCIHPLEFVIEP